MMRTIQSIRPVADAHWVGNGFPVSTMFSYQQNGAEAVSPFLLMDYAGPVAFGKSQRPRGVGSHPHKGFETVTIVYQGEIEHRDSAGHGGVIGPGEVQWMTAGAGIVHEEFHSAEFAKTGGVMEMVQLWVNLPQAKKNVPADYQSLTAAQMPLQPLGDGSSQYRVIAGTYAGVTGPARTHSDLLVMDLTLTAGEKHNITIPAEWNAWVTVLSGTVLINDQEIARDATIASFNDDGDFITFEANQDSRVLITAGAPIREPVVGYGPFVMNTWEEINAAVREFS